MEIILLIITILLSIDFYLYKKKRTSEFEKINKDLIAINQKFIDEEYKSTELQKKNTILESENISLKQIELSKKEFEFLDLNKEISSLVQDKSSLLNDIDSLNSKMTKIKDLIVKYKNDLNAYSEEASFIKLGLYTPKYDFATSLGYKDMLSSIRSSQKQMIKDKTAVNYYQNWTLDGSRQKGTKMNNDNIKMVLRAFNNECEACINKVKFNNIESIENRIQTSFDQINKLNESSKISLSDSFLKLKFEELHLGYEYELKKQEEKEVLREKREKEREEKALLKEIKSKKKKLDKEITHIQNVIEDLNIKLITSQESEKQEIQKQINDLKNNIGKFNDEKQDLDYRIENIGAGYVYIISNIGSFGENVYKIGVTRRLDPLERIHELSSASVPFKFDVHALIFSYQAYELEKELHQIFDSKRINMVNGRKEFFNITIDEIEQQLQKYKDLTIDFNKIPEAQEYRETKILLSNNSSIKNDFEDDDFEDVI